MANQDPGSSGKEFKPAPWEKEATSMEEKKNVSFVSGLALLLAVLALVMVGWSGIADSPYQIDYKDAIDGKFSNLNSRFERIEKTLMIQSEDIEKGKLMYQSFQLQGLNADLGTMKISGVQEFSDDVTALQNAVQSLINKVNEAKVGLEKVEEAKKVPEKPAAK